MNQTLKMYNNLSKKPFGKHIFSRFVAKGAPYFKSIGALVTDLREGSCTITMKDRKKVRNHINTVHAIALCNMAELAMGLAVNVSMPEGLRWIPKGMTVEYINKGIGTLTGLSNFDPGILKEGDIGVPFEIKNEAGEIVFKAVITVYISRIPKK